MVAISAIATASTLLCPHTAWAAPDENDSEALIARGIELREKGKDDEALAVFKKALSKTPSPRARAQVALAEQALGSWLAAENDLVVALASESDPWITKNRAALEGALAVVRRHLGNLEVRGTPGAEVFIDGTRLGTIPSATPFRVEAGHRTLELRATGFRPTTRPVDVPAAGTARENVKLVALPNDAVGASNGDPGTAGDGRARDVDPGRTQRLLGWVFAATGGAFLLGGGAGMVVRAGIVDDYNMQCPGLGVGQPPGCDAKIESARTWLTASIVSFVGGGVFAIGGLALVLTAPSREPTKTARGGLGDGLRASCSPTTSATSAVFLACQGSF